MEVQAPGLVELVLATGALGLAAMGVVDGLKIWPWLALAGAERLFSELRRVPGGRPGLLDPLRPALVAAYGPNAPELVRARFLEDDPELLASTLNRGVRLGLQMLTDGERDRLLAALGVPEADITRIRRAYAEGGPGEAEGGAVARLELVLRERIEAALALSRDSRRRELRSWAGCVAVILALAAAWWLGESLLWGLVVGLAAVPLAPVAKDVAEGLAAAARALRAARTGGE